MAYLDDVEKLVLDECKTAESMWFCKGYFSGRRSENECSTKAMIAMFCWGAIGWIGFLIVV